MGGDLGATDAQQWCVCFALVKNRACVVSTPAEQFAQKILNDWTEYSESVMF